MSMNVYSAPRDYGSKIKRYKDGELDFASIQKVNPDIYAWLEIKGTKVDYPILQSSTDDSKYLTTAYDGTYYAGGSVFTQATYNSKDFEDPVTAIYAHTMTSGNLFGNLQPIYTDPEKFEKYNEIIIHLPDKVITYKVFAAVPYETIHIMDTYDFENKYWFKNFFKGIKKIESEYSVKNIEEFPEYGDNVIILSTCLNNESTNRFLVMAVKVD